MSDRIIQFIVNWALLISSPLWIIPINIYFTIRDQDFKEIFITGEKPFAKMEED